MIYRDLRIWILLLVAAAVVAIGSSCYAFDEDFVPDMVLCADTAWSPDGTRIAFSSDGFDPLNDDICIVNIDGSGLTRLTTDPADDRYPSWSPNSNCIAFSSERTEQPQIWKVNADGTGLGQFGSFHREARDPAWSPDGTRIAVVVQTGKDKHTDIMLISPSGQELDWLAVSAEDEFAPSWSADGQKLVYCSDSGIWRRNADKSDKVKLTSRGPNGKWDEIQPSWSRTGDKIIYGVTEMNSTEGERTIGQTRVYVMNADGTSPHPLFSAEPVEFSQFPSCSPVSDRIAFLGGTESGGQIFIVNSDGTGLTQITHSAAIPSFSPDGGTHSGSVQVTITSTPGSTIRYTLDGTDPTESSTLYTGPITISTSSTLNAKSWKSGWFPSAIGTASYTIE